MANGLEHLRRSAVYGKNDAVEITVQKPVDNLGVQRRRVTGDRDTSAVLFDQVEDIEDALVQQRLPNPERADDWMSREDRHELLYERKIRVCGESRVVVVARVLGLQAHDALDVASIGNLEDDGSWRSQAAYAAQSETQPDLSQVPDLSNVPFPHSFEVIIPG